MRITLLDYESRSGGVRIQLDGRPFGTIGTGDVAALGLAEGGEVDEAAAQELGRRAEGFSAQKVAVRMLASRALPSAELVRRLVRRGHSKPSVELAVEALRQAGLLDDESCATHYARTRAQRQHFGPRRLLGDLRRLGVSERVAQRAVNEALESDGVDPRAVLLEAAQRKARTLQGLPPDTARRRLRAFLLRRGFAGSEVLAVVKEALPR
jgi:regulatory protein